MQALHHKRSSLLIFFTLAWLLGQATLLLHDTDFAAHANGNHCDICLQAQSLGHATLDSGTLAQAPAATNALISTAAVAPFDKPLIPQLARAPPLL